MQLHKNLQTADAAVIFIEGQSNAHAHGRFLIEKDRIKEPLKNVFSLDRAENQSFEITDVTWTGFKTFGNNLGETQDNTASMAYYLAKMWQNAIDNGIKLPNLYIVQISIGGQGIVNGMWNPKRPEKLHPGQLCEVDISLYPLALKINSLVMQNLKRQFKNPVVLGLHWIGSESDSCKDTVNKEGIEELYDSFFEGLLNSIGAPPLYLYKLVFGEIEVADQSGKDIINSLFLRQIKRYNNAFLVETDKIEDYNKEKPDRGIFARDNIHYLEKVHKWFAQSFFEEIIK